VGSSWGSGTELAGHHQTPLKGVTVPSKSLEIVPGTIKVADHHYKKTSIPTSCGRTFGILNVHPSQKGCGLLQHTNAIPYLCDLINLTSYTSVSTCIVNAKL
jgi:hypothetical protein